MLGRWEEQRRSVRVPPFGMVPRPPRSLPRGQMPRSTIALLALGLAAAAPAQALAQPQAQAGTLTCQLRPTIALIIGSRQRMIGVFRMANTGRTETYQRRITRLGLDIC